MGHFYSPSFPMSVYLSKKVYLCFNGITKPNYKTMKLIYVSCLGATILGLLEREPSDSSDLQRMRINLFSQGSTYSTFSYGTVKYLKERKMVI